MSTDKGKQKAIETFEGDYVELEEDEDAHSSTSSSDSDSDSDSNSSTSADGTTSDSDTEEEITPEYLQSLLDKARQEARRVKMLQEEKEADPFGEKDIIKLDDGEDETDEKYV